MPAMVPAIILAAGRSSRMGVPKPLLVVAPGGPTFVRTLATTLVAGGAADALVVGRPDDASLIEEVGRIEGARFVPNRNADRGQLSSVVAGLDAADRPGTTAVLVTPVDAPLIRPETVAAVLAAFGSGRARIVRATYRGRHGHPVLFARGVFDELRTADPAVGAKAVVRRYAAETLDLDVDDPAVLHDIDGPADYSRMLATGLPPA
jgi:molybdenum cofactor cytidylyltransferase